MRTLLLPLLLANPASAGFLLSLNFTADNDIVVEFLAYPKTIKLRRVMIVPANRTTDLKFSLLPKLAGEYRIFFERNGHMLSYYKLYKYHEKEEPHMMSFTLHTTSINMTSQLACGKDFYGANCDVACSNSALNWTGHYCNDDGQAVKIVDDTNYDGDRKNEKNNSNSISEGSHWPFLSWRNIAILIIILIAVRFFFKHKSQEDCREEQLESLANVSALPAQEYTVFN